MAANQASVLLGPVRRTESIWRWAPGGTTGATPGGGSASPGTGVVVVGPAFVVGTFVVVEVVVGQMLRTHFVVVGVVVDGLVDAVVVGGVVVV